MGKLYFEAPNRAVFAHQVFGDYLRGTVVDIGAGGSATYFREHLNGKYLAVDISDSRAEPDIVHDFEKLALPFEDNSFDTVLCFDVLEHVDNPHHLFDECARIARRYLIVSLPNNWPSFFWDFLLGHNFGHRAGYGLPLEPPAPGQRHKWFFNLEEAEAFIRHRAARSALEIAELRHVFERGNDALIYVNPLRRWRLPGYPAIFATENSQVRARYRRAYPLFLLAKYGMLVPASWIEEVVKRAVWGWGRYRYKNLFCRQLWAVLRRPASAGNTRREAQNQNQVVSTVS